MQNFSTNVPVFIEEIEETTDTRFSRARLKVFYQGETVDHRLFTKEFSESVFETLPYTPVVAFFDEKRDDFVGHNSTQYIYGIVPADSDNNREFKTDDDGVTWAYTDVILYTKRKDNIGEIANKIVGKQHSLEMNPETLKYKINRSSTGRFKNLEFISGEFIGLSVLGDNDHPAFPGSGFISTEDFAASEFAISHEKFDSFLQLLQTNGGIIEVFNFDEYSTEVNNKFGETMQSFIQKLYAALSKKRIYGCVCENTTDYAVVSIYEDEQYHYYKYSLGMDGENVILTDEGVRVYPKFLTEEEIQAVEGASTQDPAQAQAQQEPAAQTEEGLDTTAQAQAQEDPAANATTDPESEPQNATAQEPVQEEPVQEEPAQVATATASVSSNSLSDGERQELENLRKQAKITMINSYSATLAEDVLNNFINNVDNYTAETLEIELLRAFKVCVENKVAEEAAKVPATFSIPEQPVHYDERKGSDVIKKYL